MSEVGLSRDAGSAPLASYSRLWLAIVLGCFVTRLVWALLVPIHPVSDTSAYDELARNLAFTGSYAWNTGLLTAYWPVGAPFYYSLFFRLFEEPYLPIALANVLLGTASVILIMALARRWLSDRVALFSGLLFAFWPMQIQFTSIMASELQFNFLMLLALWLTLEAPFRSMVLRAALVGVVTALASFVRVQALLFPLLLMALMLWRHRSALRELLLFGAVTGAVMLLCIAPWTARNTQLFGERILIATNAGGATWAGNNPDATTGEYMAFPADVEALGEVERDRILGQRAREFILANPGRFVELSFRRLYTTHNRETMGVVWNQEFLGPHVGERGILLLKAGSSAYWLGCLILGLIGAVLMLRRQKAWALLSPMILLWAYFAAVHAVTQGSDRYHLPSVPFIAMLAGLTLSSAWLQLMARRAGRAPAADPRLAELRQA